jgi:hypothetical protein
MYAVLCPVVLRIGPIGGTAKPVSVLDLQRPFGLTIPGQPLATSPDGRSFARAMTKYLLLFATTEGQTRKIARFIADRLLASGHSVTLAMGRVYRRVALSSSMTTSTEMATGMSIDHIATLMGSICRTSRRPGTNAAPTWTACAPKTAPMSGLLLLKGILKAELFQTGS